MNIKEGYSLSTTEFVSEIEEILRKSIKKFMNLLTQYPHDKLLTSYLDDNVLAGGDLL
jgi:hypothetical protein